ncbi:hypothetical protein [uncultured Parasutterella sp.]|uniref:hypothetical protein n=1 Tax=uncultured Parasutterella sp. TaxID=1263098 RepID=UPI002597F43A|nr:hypothetical protein [uncultured Parasutterella sp.]
MKQESKLFGITILSAAVLGLSACTSYDHKDYPRESWFTQPTQVIEADQFKKVEEPLKVSLVVNYLWEGRPIVTEPFEERPADWREQYGLWFAAERYLEETGLFKIVKEDDKEKQGVMTIDVTRAMSGKTKAAVAAKKADPDNHPEKIVYEYDMTMKMDLSLADGKKFEAVPKTDHMFIGHEDSKERELGQDPKRFTFSYFNNMDFHTEFVRRFYKQMIFEGVKAMEEKGL